MRASQRLHSATQPQAWHSSTGEKLGVLKAVLDISEIRTLLAARAREDLHIRLVTRDAQVVFDSRDPGRTELANGRIGFNDIVTGAPVGSSERVDPASGDARLVSHARSTGPDERSAAARGP